MKIKKYIFASFILINIVGWYIYGFMTQESLRVDFFGLEIATMPIALWVAVVMGVLFLASLLHMIYYSFKNSLTSRRYAKDFDHIVDAVVDAYLAKEPKTQEYKMPRYKLLGSVIANSKVFPKSFKLDVDDKRVLEVLEVLEKIANGEVAELKRYSLPISNDLVIQNERNRYKKGELSAEVVLANPNRYDASLAKEVFVDFVKKAPLDQILKYKNYLTKDALFEFLPRINGNEETLIVENATLINLIKDLSLSKDEYIAMSRALSKSMLPEQRMKLFETLSNEKESVADAYIYTLFDLEMVSMAKEILANTKEGEYAKFKMFVALKDCNKHFNIDHLI